MPLLRHIELFLRRTGLAPTTFGREAAHDPRFVFDLRNGRTVGTKLDSRVRTWMTEQKI